MSGVNPLDGQPLPWYLEVVTGPPETGNRKTVVDIRAGATLMPWIDRVDVPAGTGATVTYFVDNGLAGGTYEGPQRLPDLVTTAPKPFPWWVAVLIGLGALAAIKSRGGRSW